MRVGIIDLLLPCFWPSEHILNFACATELKDVMPDKCCIVGHNSNYKDGPMRSAFFFPNDPDLKAKWIQFVGQK